MSSNSNETDSANSIAIVGLTCRFPGARNLDEFWENLRNGIESVTYFTAEELEAAGVDPDLVRQPNYVRAAALLDGADLFDASFFGINPREAELIDPQHRIFLECAWEALENAGYDSEKYDGWIGVYGGAAFNSYLSNQLQSNRALMAAMGYLQSLISNEKDYLTSRVSYKLNLKGPSVNVQTACSTGLVAVHLSCQSLLTYQCDMAIAGAVSAYSPQKSGYLYLEDGIQSPDGHTRSFDAQAQGTLFGSGVGVVVLKRLADALADGDTIHAVIRGTAINNDGSLKVGYTAPSVEGLSRVIAMALGNAEVKAETISYIEAHGTATALGDPVELSALNKVFRRTSACALGSVKTNFGHLNAAAGLAGLIKTVLALQHKQIPPSLHFNQPNPSADWEQSPFYVNTGLAEWKAGKWPRRAGVNSMGVGGTNAHVVLEEAPEPNASATSARSQLLLVSAKSEMALEDATERLAVHLEQHPEQNLADVAYTLQVGRRNFAHRRIVVCNDTANAVTALRSRQSHSVFTGRREDEIPPLVFLFPGQGAQYVNMGRDLYEEVPAFRRQIDQCAALLKRHVAWDLREVLYPPPGREIESDERLKQTEVAQPALFAIEHALATLLISLGIRPAAMIGHSIGEYVAACLAGVFTLEEGLALVSARGRLMQGVAAGSMLAVSVPATELESMPLGTLSLAATNCATQCVVSGRDEAVTELERYLGQQGVDCRRLHTSHAFHSSMMDGILNAFHEEVRNVALREPQLPYLSNITGKRVTAAEATDPSCWARHLRSPVRFAESVLSVLGESKPAFVEVGPGQPLSSLVKQIANPARPAVFPTLGHRQKTESEHECLLKTIGRLWLQGHEIDWGKYYEGEFRRRVPLPTYPFERQRFWVNAQRGTSERAEAQKSLRRKMDVADWFYVPVWKGSVIPEFVPEDHHSCWLIFTDEFGLGGQLARRLEQEHFTVFTVKAGEHFSRDSEKSFTINPRVSSGYDELLKEISGLGLKLAHVVHAWSITGSGEASFDLMQSLGFYSLLELVQSLGRQGGTEPLRIDVLTDDMQQVIGNEKLRPEKATVLGPCKVAPQEYQHLSMRSIDFSLPPPVTTIDEKLLDAAVAELCGSSKDAVVAYRNQKRWVQTFEQHRIEKPARANCRLRERGVYLITGGLGGIGLVLAEHLAKSVQARLVLVGRTSFPPRESWTSWLLDHDEAGEVSRRIRKLQELESHGAQIIVESADVTDERKMREVLDHARSVFGKINGVIHAAGVPAGGIIQLKTTEQAAGILAPKVQGTRVLSELFENGELDFMLLCSSRTAVLGAFGQVDYCAANAFLDAFAYYNSAKKNFPTISVDWDGWDDVGMRVNTAAAVDRNRETGIAPHEGVDAFDRILGRMIGPQVVVSTKNLDASLERAGVSMHEHVLQEIEKLQSQREEPLHPRPNMRTPYVAPANELEQIIAKIWQDLFSIEPIGVDDDFFELGGDSLLGIQLNSRLRESFSIEMPLAHLFESRTVYGLAQVISEKLGQKEAPDAMAELLAELDGLSEEEAQRQLDSGGL